MKRISIFIAILVLICNSECYSQKNSKEHRLKVKENSKGLSLKLKDLKTVEKNGKTGWTVKAILKNKSPDTLFYFVTKDCEPGYYLVMAMVDSIQLFTDFKACDPPQQTVIAIPPSGQRSLDLEIISKYSVPPSFKCIVFFQTHKAKNRDERIPQTELFRKRDREIWVQSNQIKIRTRAGNSKA